MSVMLMETDLPQGSRNPQRILRNHNMCCGDCILQMASRCSPCNHDWLLNRI